MNKTAVIALLDKAFPPSHSFVDGMLGTTLSNVSGVNVYLLVSRNKSAAACQRYLRAICLSVLWERRGAGRFLNLFVAYFAVRSLIRREKARNHRVSLFVRNDPVYLAVASLFKSSVDRLVFQSSFPHEQTGGFLKRAVALVLYRFAADRIDGMLAVSPQGIKRIRKLFPVVPLAGHIPLMADVPSEVRRLAASRKGVFDPPVFLYVGTHALNRDLETVLSAIVSASSGVKGRFLFLGGEAKDISRLQNVAGVGELVDAGVVQFRKKVPRSEVWKQMLEADIGLCLIPPIPIFHEASPTKLGEYYGCGMAVLANSGLPLLEAVVNESQAGIIVPFEKHEIASAIRRVLEDKDGLLEMKRSALAYARDKMNYQTHLPLLLEMLGISVDDVTVVA